jgi:hypothetical protein
MKATVLIAGLLVSVSAFGQSDQIIKRHAKEQVQQNNVRQGVAPPTQAPPSASAPTPPPASLPVVKADLAAVKANAAVTADQKQKIANDLIAGAQGTKPTQAAALKLAEELTKAFATKPLSAASLARFVQELDAVLNPSKFPQAKMEAIYADIQAIFQENGQDRKQAVAIVEATKGLVAK